MFLEKHLQILLVLALRFLCVLCNNDASTPSGTTIAKSTELDYNSGSTENLEIIYDDESTKNTFMTTTDDNAITTSYESTVEPLKTVSHLVTDKSSSSIINHITTRLVTVPNNVISIDSTINTTICNPMYTSVDTKEVVDLKTDDIGTEWIVFSWKSPCKVTNSSITYFIEICDDKKNCTQTYGIDTWHNATDLDPCTQYEFKVKINTSPTVFWDSKGVVLSATTAIPEFWDADVISLSARTINVNVIQLTWQAPAIHEKCISNYSITQCDEKSCNKTAVLVTNYTTNDLELCTEYHFTVKTVMLSVESYGVNETAKTVSPKLSAPQSLHVIPGNFSLTVKWEPPESGTFCLKHYYITTDFNYTTNTTNTSVIISHLHACKMYQIFINAVNEDDKEGDTIDKSATTLPYRTNPPLLHTPGIPPSVRSLSMIWTIQKENNHCQLSSIITICNYTEQRGKGYEPENRVSPMNIDPDIAAEPVFVLNTIVEGLSPFTSYTCWAHTVNIAGYSDLSVGVNATTLEDVSSPPEFSVRNITDSQFSLSWNEPDYLPGYLEEFEIAIYWKPLYSIPNWCPREEQDMEKICFNSYYAKKFNVSGSVFEYDYLEAKGFTDYKVYMRARTGEGWSNISDPHMFASDSGVPGAISKFNSSITIKENSNDTNVLDTILTWGLPCSLNGELEFFNVSGVGIRPGYPPHFIFEKYECTNYIRNDYMCSINLNELKGEYNYNFTISTKIRNVDTLGWPVNQNVLYPAGIPPQPTDEIIKSITLDPYKARKTTTTAAILLPLFPNTSGEIKFYAIMVAKIGYNNIRANTRFDLKSNNWPNAPSWEEAMMNDFSITYQATWPHWNPYPNYIADYGHVKAVKYIIGEDVNCKEISSNMDERVYCNGPLHPDTWYHIRMRAFTDGGYTDSEIFMIKTNAELNIALIIGAVFGILSVGIAVTMMLLVRKCSPYIVLRRFLHSDMPGSPVPAPFTRRKFMSHCQQLVDNPGKLSNEFRLLQTLSVDLQMPTNSACLQANRKKNRYSDILPYDFSRVKLDVIDNDPNTDYINASFIRGYTGEDEYIACQGPKEETTYDFWRMINQYNINIIVMLTQLVEKGKEKCHQYYPTTGETFRYEDMIIRCTSELDFRTHTQRTLVLQKENKKRNITHLHFKDWPDHDVPEDFDPMINFCQIMRRNIIANKGSVVVHCSAGIGRTGTLIAIDILLQQIRDNRKLDVFGTVYRLRHHRINMVQRESQYAYIYNCIKQVLKNPYFLKTYKPPPVEPIYENTSKKAKDTTNSDTTLVNNLEIYLRQCKSMDAINIKTHHIPIEKSRTLNCIFKPLRDSYKLINRESLIQESIPLITYSSSTNVLGDSVQHVTNTM
ncbi:receptor-type tyrosine-protein phosphatase beta isoform X2 [Mycetomoellerius zeteki]|uniref:receptor-type tyrosine-protein phosphatase beta isoform X2 n=1 Tax=Mycetomoellerius zeteki TaxID=64791 RepID=UPI00084E8A38|nr:PREDICTED: receptor-type tyrosine-protein phosphatase beta isoform X2 [Trachymyrmex zeteki]